MNAWVNVVETFEAAHHLPNYEGPCHNVHGHSYKVEVGVYGEVGADGMVLDMSRLKKRLRELLAYPYFDHALLNVAVPNPTAENIAYYVLSDILRWLDKEVGRSDLLAKVKVWETADAYVEMSYDDL